MSTDTKVVHLSAIDLNTIAESLQTRREGIELCLLTFSDPTITDKLQRSRIAIINAMLALGLEKMITSIGSVKSDNPAHLGERINSVPGARCPCYGCKAKRMNTISKSYE